MAMLKMWNLMIKISQTTYLKIILCLNRKTSDFTEEDHKYFQKLICIRKAYFAVCYTSTSCGTAKLKVGLSTEITRRSTLFSN